MQTQLKDEETGGIHFPSKKVRDCWLLLELFYPLPNGTPRLVVSRPSLTFAMLPPKFWYCMSYETNNHKKCLSSNSQNIGFQIHKKKINQHLNRLLRKNYISCCIFTAQ